MSIALLAGLASFSASILLVWSIRHYALRRGVVDVPNERSSHSVPTPRGGGIGIVVPVIVFLSVVPMTGLTRPAAWAAAAAVGLVALLGWVDDHRSLGVTPRLMGHVVAGLVMAAVALEGGASPGGIGAFAVAGAWWVFWTVSSINVVNFMDGIDGIIGLQAAVYGAFVFAVLPRGTSAAALALVVVGASVGFLLFNWAPARIFMGDVGSGSLGVIFVLMGMVTIRETGWTIVHAYLPCMPIFADEVLTMGRRMMRGERLSEPHRSHVYQLLVQAGWGHAPVAALYGLLAAACAVWAISTPGAVAEFWVGSTALLAAVLALLALLRAAAERRIAGAGPAPDREALC